MQRTFAPLSHRTYDVLVIGGGIYGISVARDATLRGLAVVLVDQGDFGSAASANHHKIIHGGLRYLQHADFRRMRESIRERSILMRIAPHLVAPMPFLIPTYKSFLQSKLILWIALKLNDLISFDRNRNLALQRMIPNSRILSKEECLQLCDSLDQHDLTGGALFFDGQVVNPDRLNLSLLFSAAKAGAHALNYARVTGFLREQSAIKGVQIKDVLSGRAFDIHARVVVNCSGAWVEEVLGLLRKRSAQKHFKWLKAVVLVTRSLTQEVAIGIPGSFRYKDKDAFVDKGRRYFFITPWRNTSLIGTFQTPHESDPDDVEVTEHEIEDLLYEVNSSLPGVGIKRQDVYYVYRGLLPMTEEQSGGQLMKQYAVYDHAVGDDIQGLISVVGVKYTTARHVAEKAVNLVERKLGKQSERCQTASIPVYGGTMYCFDEFVQQALKEKPVEISENSFRHLIQTYGSAYQEILRYYRRNPLWGQLVSDNSPVIKAEVLHGVREEMAQKLSDILFRRTELGVAGYPGAICINACAEIMGAELGWDTERIQREIEETLAAFPQHSCHEIKRPL